MEREKLKKKQNTRQRKSLIAFNAEGINKTERLYLKNFISRDLSIKMAPGNNTDPISMYNELLSFCKKEDISSKNGDKIFLFIDTDLRDDKIESINILLKKCEKDGIELILSIPMFEIWFINHFRYSTKQFKNNNDVIKELKKHISDYEKNKNIYEQLKDKVNIAIENSIKLEKHHQINNADLYSNDANPYTAVYKVIQEIINIKNNNTNNQ